MKRKKVWGIAGIIIILVVEIFTLAMCKNNYYKYYQLNDGVKLVEIYKFDYQIKFINPNVKLPAKLIRSFDIGQSEEILLELSHLKYHPYIGMEPPYLGDYFLKIYFEDESYQIICFNSSFKINGEGTKISTKRWECSKEKFDEMILRFIDIETE